MERRTIGEAADWAVLRQRFRWRIPERFNIARACCDDWAAADPDRLAILHETPDGTVIRWSFGALKDASDRLAAAFAARGVGRGDRVAILLPQCPEVMVVHFAAMKLGAVTLPLFTLFGADALGFRLADAGARLAVTDAENLDKLLALRPDLPDLAEVVVTGAARPGARGMADEIQAAGPLGAAADTLAEDPAMLIYTSGTTGPPKGALHAHRFLIGHQPSVELQHEFFPRPGDMGWTPADWAWIGGLMNLALSFLYHGVPLLARRFAKFDPEAAFDLIARHGVRNMFLPPTALRLMRQARVPAGLAVRSVGSGGEALGADLHDWGRAALGAPINEIYGQTECNLVISTCHGAGGVRPGTMGRAVPGHDVAIRGPDGPAAPGELGEICIRAPDPAMFLGYWNRPEKTAEKLRDGWLRTGDLGRCDAEGWFAYVARDDDVIASAGYRIGPTEIETCLTGDPDVVMAAAVGLPDPVRGEIVAAFVVLRDGAVRDGLVERLTERVRTRVSPHVAPRRIEVLEALPVTATGKIMRRTLRDRYGAAAPAP